MRVAGARLYLIVRLCGERSNGKRGEEGKGTGGMVVEGVYRLYTRERQREPRTERPEDPEHVCER